jgi:hypothetical protein
MHSRVMTWQTHYRGHALSPPPTGRDESEGTPVELVLAEHSYEQVELTAILSFCYSCYFQHSGFTENKRRSFKLLILCVIILNMVQNKNTLT